jgi:hypothetical protein
MKRLVLLDADVIIDLHTLGLFESLAKGYDVSVARSVFHEARYYPYHGKTHRIDIKDKVTIIDAHDEAEILKVKREAYEALLGIDPGETESIAYISSTEKDILFCTCDTSAIRLVSYMGLEHKSISMEKALQGIGKSIKGLSIKHSEKHFQENIKSGKALRIQYKKIR